MPLFRTIDDNNDWNFGRGLNDYAVDHEAVKLNIKTRLQSWLGDCYFAVDAGVDWLNKMDIGQQKLLEIDIRNVILKTSDVTGIIDFSIAVIDRKAIINYNVTTTFSESTEDTIEV